MLVLKDGSGYGLGVMELNKHAQALGRLARGVKKTLSPAAIRQRKLAAKSHSRLAKERKNETAQGN